MRILTAAFLPGAVALAIIYVALPTVAIRTIPGRWFRSRVDGTDLMIEAQIVWSKHRPKSLTEARTLLDAVPKPENHWLGGVAREEDSPGNYVIRQTPGGYKLVMFQRDGSERTLNR